MISVRQKGEFAKLTQYLQKLDKKVKIDFDSYGRQGVQALASATPRDTGLTADSWYYEIENKNGYITLTWYNSNVNKDWFNVAIMLQYGHATGSGIWIEGVDYINPALKPIFEQIKNEIWKAVTSK